MGDLHLGVDRKFQSRNYDDFLHYLSTGKAWMRLIGYGVRERLEGVILKFVPERWIKLEWESCMCLMRNQVGVWHPRSYSARGSCPELVDRLDQKQMTAIVGSRPST